MAAMTEQPVSEPSRDGADPGLTIIIVSWRVPEMLRECLRSIVEKGGLPVSSLQIIVVDNASGDGTIEMLRAEFPAVQSIASQINLGFGRANTLAWRHARAPLVLLRRADSGRLRPAVGCVHGRRGAAPERSLGGQGAIQPPPFATGPHSDAHGR
jgi:hypothetical protein